jgi:hypothetical protein
MRSIFQPHPRRSFYPPAFPVFSFDYCSFHVTPDNIIP